MINYTDASEIVLTAVNKNRGYSLQYSFENSFFVDGVAYAGHVGRSTNFTDLPGFLVTEILGSNYFSDLTICKDADEIENSMVGHWRNLSYDPNLIVLFSDGANDSSKQRKAVNIAAAVAVPVVILAVIGVVLLVLFVPPVYKAVLPSDPLKRQRFKLPNPADDDAIGGMPRDRAETKAAPTVKVSRTQPSAAAVAPATTASTASASAAPATSAAPASSATAEIAPAESQAPSEDAPRSTWTKVRKPDQ